MDKKKSRQHQRMCIKMATFLTLLFLSALLGFVEAQVPQLCNGRYCIAGQAQCVGNKCVCDDPPYTYGDGYFNCYKKSQVRAEILNDPTLNAVTNETSALTVPCRVLVSSVKQELKKLVGRPVNIGFCYVQVHSFQARNRGKFYVAGYEVAIRLEYTNGTRKEVSSVVSGTLNDVQLHGTDNAFLPDGPYADDDVNFVDAANNIVIKRYFDSNNVQYVFEADACGIRVTLVPYDTVNGLNRLRVPGLSVAINCIHHPRYLDNDRVIGLAPKSQGGFTLQDINNLYPGTTAVEALAAFAFTRNVAQIQPYVSTECPLVNDVLGQCNVNLLANALHKCYWIFGAAKFVNCISGPGSSPSTVLSLFRLCLDSYCNGNDQCNPIQSIVGSCTNPTGPQLNNLLNDVCLT